jgi:hypothetical protein
MPEPANHDLKLYRNDTLDTEFTFTGTGGTPLDFSGCVARMQFRTKPDEAPVLSLSSEDDELLISGNTITANNVVVAADKGTYLYDLEIAYPSGAVRTYVRGKAVVEADITL